MNVGQCLRRLRAERGMDETELAELVHMTPDQIRQVETGARQVNHENLEALATALGVSVDIFFQDEPVEEVPATGQSLLIPQAQLAALLDQMND